MRLDWDLTAQSYFDQLSPEERSKVSHAVQRLAADWDGVSEGRLSRLSGDLQDMYSLRVGADLRVLLWRRGDVVTIVDIVRRSQVDGLRRLAEAGRAATG